MWPRGYTKKSSQKVYSIFIHLGCFSKHKSLLFNQPDARNYNILLEHCIIPEQDVTTYRVK